MDWKLKIILTAVQKVIYVLLSEYCSVLYIFELTHEIISKKQKTQDTWPCMLEKKHENFNESDDAIRKLMMS